MLESFVKGKRTCVKSTSVKFPNNGPQLQSKHCSQNIRWGSSKQEYEIDWNKIPSQNIRGSINIK